MIYTFHLRTNVGFGTRITMCCDKFMAVLCLTRFLDESVYKLIKVNAFIN